MKRLSAKQQQCLRSVARGKRPPNKRTVESLARAGLVEHTSIGWRLTAEGVAWIETKAPRFQQASSRQSRGSRRKAARDEQPATQLVPDTKISKENTPQQPSFSRAQDEPHVLSGDLPSVTVKDEAEALFYFARIDERLAEAWKRDVVMPAGPITIRRAIATRFGSTHYAYVDRRLLWYLKHDPSDPLGAKWEGYLRSPGDVPRGATVMFVGRDFVAKKCPPQLVGDNS
jgi:hypothetical protein